MSIQTFTLPDPGEGLTEAEILSWYVAVGDDVTVNQVFVEVETAKAAVELPSPFAGRVAELLAAPGESVAVGTPIIRIDTDPYGAAGPVGTADPAAPITGETARPVGTVDPAPPIIGEAARPVGTVDPAAPITGEAAGVGNAAAEVGPAAVAAANQGTGSEPPAGAKIGEPGADGRIATLVGYVAAPGGATRRPRRSPVQAAAVPPVPMPTPGRRPGPPPAPMPTPVPKPDPVPMPTPAPDGPARAQAPRAAPPVRKLARDLGVDLTTVRPARADGVITRAEVEQAASAASPAAPSGPDRQPDGAERRVPVRGVRKVMAQAMTSSAFTAPHVTVFLTVDVTPMMELREQLKQQPAFTGIRLSPLTFAARAVCLAVRATPEINATWDGEQGEIVLKDEVHLGIAADTPRGLVVPVIRQADRMDLAQLAAALGKLTETARAGRSTPADLTGGTVSITNVGVFGIDTGTPIINPGESAILAVGAIRAAPWVVGGQLAVRQVCQLALSFDHRVLDGAQGSRFLAEVGALFAQPGLALAY